MNRRDIGLAIAVWAAAGPAVAKSLLNPRWRIETVATGFRTPWSLAFLPEGDMLVTERRGRLWRLGQDGSRREIRGVPEVAARGQGGLFDVVVPQDHETSGELLLSYAKPQSGGQGTALAAAGLKNDRLTGMRVLFEMASGWSGGRHFGGRIVEARDGTLYLTLGDRGDDDQAQDLSNHNGSIVRLARDGSVPPDNPFAGTPGARPEIWSYGHRNPQGAALDARGQLWAVEHGAMGGDEVNRIRKGGNFGWPVISYGRHYSGAKIGVGTHKEGMAQPNFYWDPSIAPSGLAFHSGKLFPGWKGAMFVGSLKFDHIAVLDRGAAGQIDTIKASETVRVRDVREGPDGTIWFLSEGNGALCRIVPG